jgi:hypothetical protein
MLVSTKMIFPEFDISTTVAPTTQPYENDTVPRKGLSSVEIGVITAATAIAIVGFCMLLSVVRSRN